MKTHEYFCQRFHHIEWINQEKRLWDSIKEILVTRWYIKSITGQLSIDKVDAIGDQINTLIESHGLEIRRAIRQTLIKLTCVKLQSIRAIVNEWSVHALRKYKQIHEIEVVSVSVQAIERSDEGLSIRNIIGDPPIPFELELVTYRKAYCVITRLRCPDGAVICDKEIIDEVCLDW